MNKYRVKIIDSLTAWSEISKSWNELLMQSKSNTIFLTWEWLYAWAECYLGKDRQLFILAVYEKEELIGIAPWYIERFRFGPAILKKIKFLGSPETSSDYLDIFTRLGKESEVALFIYNYLFLDAASRWNVLELKDIPANSLFFLHFTNKIKEDEKYFDIREGAFCPNIILPKSWEQFMSEISTSRSKRLSQDIKNLEKAGSVNYYSFPSTDIDSDLPLKRFFSLYNKRWGDNHKQFFSFLEKFTSISNKANWVNLDLLSNNGEDIAGLFLLRYQNTLSMYLMASDTTYNKKISIGNILTGFSIKKAIENGISKYDFLKGDEDYKFYWAKQGKRCLNLYFPKRDFGTILYTSKRILKGLAKAALK